MSTKINSIKNEAALYLRRHFRAGEQIGLAYTSNCIDNVDELQHILRNLKTHKRRKGLEFSRYADIAPSVGDIPFIAIICDPIKRWRRALTNHQHDATLTNTQIMELCPLQTVHVARNATIIITVDELHILLRIIGFTNLLPLQSIDATSSSNAAMPLIFEDDMLLYQQVEEDFVQFC